VYELKRLPLIFYSLNACDNIQIEWTHIGNGPDFEKIKDIVSREKKDHLSVNLIGRLPHPDVLRYYKTHEVDLFINLSRNEGIPVSIMEAISFNVPIVATNVGSTSEIITEETGILVSSNPSPSEVASAIKRVLKKHLTPRDFWKREFNSDVNYKEFVEYRAYLNSIIEQNQNA